MTKPSQRAEVNNFVKGLITEASPLNYPANASIDEENFELNRDGTRDRRLGMGYESDFARNSTNIFQVDADSVSVSTFTWESVSGVLTDDFLVVQLEKVLKFYDINSSSLSGEGFIGEIELTNFPSSSYFALTCNYRKSCIIVIKNTCYNWCTTIAIGLY